MKNLFIIVAVALTSTQVVLGANKTNSFRCMKGNDLLSLTVGMHLGGGPTFSKIRKNNNPDLEIFSDILNASKKCEDLRSYVNVPDSEVLICLGEMFAPKGVYGQVILTKGSIKVFKEVLAPASGWICE